MTVLAITTDTTNQLIAAGAALGGTIIGGLITFFTTVWQTRKSREAELAAGRRARAAEILGQVRVFLTDIDPVRIEVNLNAATTPNQLDALGARLDTLREKLATFAATFDDDQIMGRATQLEVALFNTNHHVRWLAGDRLKDRDATAARDHARLWHEQARLLVSIVLDLVRGRDVAELGAQLDPQVEKIPPVL